MNTTVLSQRQWLRLADPDWQDPLDPTFSASHGGRWNARGAHPTLYFNADLHTARANVRAALADYSAHPEDFSARGGPTLVTAQLPARLEVADAVRPDGLKALGLPPTYPRQRNGRTVAWSTCQRIGAAVHAAGHAGVWCRSAACPADRPGEELAWFPRPRQRAQLLSTRHFGDWYYD
jgi:RES domain-containing protein